MIIFPQFFFTPGEGNWGPEITLKPRVQITSEVRGSMI